MGLSFLHVLMAVLASWRLTEIITLDRISEPLRKRFPWYIWTCGRCVSVWAGAFAALLFYFFPWANWPLGISWTYLWHLEWVIAKRKATERPQVVIELMDDEHINITRSDFGPHDLARIGDELTKFGVKI